MLNMKKFKKNKRQVDQSPLLRGEHAFPSDVKEDDKTGVLITPCSQKTLNIQMAQSYRIDPVKSPVALDSLAEVLEIGPDVLPGPSEVTMEIILKASVDKNFQNVTTEGDKQVHSHLKKLQNTILHELLKLGPLLNETQFLDQLIHFYHKRTFEHLDQVLLSISTTEQAFTLLDWVLHTYISPEFMGHPDLKAVQNLDLLLLCNWVTHAEGHLRGIIQGNLATLLGNILQNEESDREASITGNEEAFVRLHLDTIQYIEAVLKEALRISPTFKTSVEKDCFVELQNFVKRYISAEKKHLKKYPKTSKYSVVCFFKTFNNCKELKEYIQTTGKNKKIIVYTETILALENMERFAMRQLLETIDHLAEISLKRYFSRHEQKHNLTTEIKQLLDPLPQDLEAQRMVMSKAYERITTLYFQILVQTNHEKLKKRWLNVGKRVIQDADLLHNMFKCLNQMVEQSNLILLKVGEIIECRCDDTLKLLTACTVKECSIVSVDHMTALLKWKGGLTGRQVRDVVAVCQDVSGSEFKAGLGYRFWFCCGTRSE